MIETISESPAVVADVLTDPQPRASLSATSGSPPPPYKPMHAEIEVLAYQKWVSDGCPPGNGVDFWLEAEKDLIEQNSGTDPNYVSSLSSNV